MLAYEIGAAGRQLLIDLPESGPGYQLIELSQGDIVVPAGKYIVFLAELMIELNDFVQFLTGHDPQNPPRSFPDYNAFKLAIVPTPRRIASLPSSPVPTTSSPATPWPVSPTLVATHVTAGGEVFWRLCAVNPDPRLRGGTLTPGTYLTSDDDMKLVNTGFGAVGRYALPSPFPASHVARCTPAPGETFRVGTTRPNFGQAGGGVEVLFPTHPVPAAYARAMPNW